MFRGSGRNQQHRVGVRSRASRVRLGCSARAMAIVGASLLGPAGPCQVRAVRLFDEDSGAVALAISPAAGKLLKLAAVEGTHEGWHYSFCVVRTNAENLTETLDSSWEKAPAEPQLPALAIVLQALLSAQATAETSGDSLKTARSQAWKEKALARGGGAGAAALKHEDEEDADDDAPWPSAGVEAPPGFATWVSRMTNLWPGASTGAAGTLACRRRR